MDLDVKMEKCCYICGVLGFKELLVSCMKCKSISIHVYCMKSMKFIASDDWFCEDCQDTPKHDKLSNRTLAWETPKRCKMHCGQEHSTSVVPEPSSKRQSSADRPVTTISKVVSTKVILHNSEHIKRYKTLKGRRICNTRYLDEGMLDTLGLGEGVKWMANQVGWTQFLTMIEPTYISLTREFLSTVKVISTEGRITFRLQNKDRKLTLKQFNNIFGFPSGGDKTKPKEYQANEFWKEITDEPHYNPNIAPASAMYNPCFRVMQCLMANTIFGRGRCGKRVVRTDELFHLWAMAKNYQNLDTGKLLALHLQSVGKAKAGNVTVGGLVTSIARYFNINMEGLAQATGNHKIDLDLCLKMKMIVFHDSGYSLQFNSINTLWPLPDPANTTPKIQRNWKRTFQLGIQPKKEDEEPDLSNKDGGSSSEPFIQTLHNMLQAQQCEMEDIRSMVQEMYKSHLAQTGTVSATVAVATDIVNTPPR